MHYFLNWLNLWDGMTKVTGKLINETFTALKHTTTAILHVTDYCINELNMKYILPGKFQTDQWRRGSASIGSLHVAIITYLLDKCLSVK